MYIVMSLVVGDCAAMLDNISYHSNLWHAGWSAIEGVDIDELDLIQFNEFLKDITGFYEHH
jgi:hypothetical protein